MVAQLEPRIDLFDVWTFPGTQDRFVEVLQQHVVDLPQRQYVTVVVVHELLHSELRFGVAIAETLRQGALVVEQQPILLASRDEMQPETHLEQESATVDQPGALLRREVAVSREFAQVRRAEVPLGDPADGLDVSQAPWAALDIGFEVVLDIVELRVPLRLLVALGGKERAARPDPPSA